VRALFSPSLRGRAAEGGRGSLTHHLELQLSNTPFQPWLQSFAAPRLKNAWQCIQLLIQTQLR
jgi:hypothetical protein